ncbi:MAG: hypothetical protein AB7F59_14085 [Bdellovibrionales bacterium]
MMDRLIEKLLNYFTGAAYREEVIQAKKDFFEDAGLVGDESAYYEMRMSQFLDWYLFTRELSKTHLPPVQYAIENNLIGFEESDHALFESFGKCQHSLFEFIKVRGGDVYIRDLFTGKKIELRDSHVTSGFNSDEIFETRVIPYNNTHMFAKGFCFHPAEAKSFILKEIKKVKHLDMAQKEALMFRLLKMRYKFEQYKHIRLEYIYTNDVKLRI